VSGGKRLGPGRVDAPDRIAARTRINPGNHPLDRVALSHFTYRSSAFGFGRDDPELFNWRRASRCVLGSDVRIRHGATVLPGVATGGGAAVGAGAVVSRDVSPFAVVVGVPAKLIRYRFPAEIISALRRTARWGRPRDQLGAAIRDFDVS
jgi:acetyltransferase-like isoleucine patch superfamily enzyme